MTVCVSLLSALNDSIFRYMAATKLSTLCTLYCEQEAAAAAASGQLFMAPNAFDREQVNDGPLPCALLSILC